MFVVEFTLLDKRNRDGISQAEINSVILTVRPTRQQTRFIEVCVAA
jgi:hypothetical protein